MKILTPEERIRLNFLYDLLDANYRGLAEAARIQRAAILHGCYRETALADMNLVALSQCTTAVWSQIQVILNPPEAAEAEAQGGPGAPDQAEPTPKDTIQ